MVACARKRDNDNPTVVVGTSRAHSISAHRIASLIIDNTISTIGPVARCDDDDDDADDDQQKACGHFGCVSGALKTDADDVHM